MMKIKQFLHIEIIVARILEILVAIYIYQMLIA